MPPAAILDIDGTLVDTNYHHSIAWYRAFRQHGIVLPIWRIHTHMGMGGDQLVASLTSDAVEEEKGDDIRAAEKALYMAFIEEIEPMEGARELIVELTQRGSDGGARELREGGRGGASTSTCLTCARSADAWTTSADVEATKPEPDLVKAAIEKAGDEDAVMVGDTTWDIKAAKRAGIPTIAVITGGFSREELEDAGAVAVFESVAELRSGWARRRSGL